MGPAIVSLIKQLTSESNVQLPKIFTPAHLNLVFKRSYYYTEKVPRTNLYTRISLIGSPNISVAPILDQWIEDGKKVRSIELQSIIRALRARKRFNQALEVSEWMSNKGAFLFFPGDRAVQLDLIGKVRGIQAAETYFEELAVKSEKIYGAFLNCCVREGLVEKSLSLLQKMKDKGFATSPLTYNDIMCLYLNMGQLEKIPLVLSEMKETGVCPDNFSYRICINSYGSRSDFNSIENLLNEVESQPDFGIDWSTYTTAASVYIKAGFNEKARSYMKKAEEKVQTDARGYNSLITLYASLGEKTEMMRIWGLKKTATKRQINNDYMTMTGSLVKLGELEEAETLFNEWESAGNLYDFRVPNVLLIGYTQNGFVEKAEMTLDGIIGRGNIPIPNSWGIIAAGFVGKGKMKKAFECMTKAFALQPQNPGWLPKPGIVSSILDWLGREGKDEEVESFINSLKRIASTDGEIYHALIRAHLSKGDEVEEAILADMKADNNR
ncbi:hypothetical protein Nepgr_026136 [Nepenthes gracilis]|uniref:Pentatricopeptide repeat-containing protein n=1 Tax=Nepenthes gracilis TaxID=150966 RepID=A0AAD3T7G3_NEPGR|nr:hypothetical protein Nepgr_026136 [Nepenthes gracilis]